MFCTKCGSQLEDGAKFCTNCGAQTRFAQVPTPAPETAAPVVPAAPAAPQAQQQPPQQWQQPQSQPPQPQSQPPQPQPQPQWQQQPQQWQQIQQQWQQQQRQAVQAQQATRQQPPQPQQPQWQQPPQQPQWQQPAAAQPKKKGKGGLIAGIVAAVLVVAVGVGGFVWPGFFKKSSDGSGGGLAGIGGSGGKSGGVISTAIAEKFSTPEEFYQTIETNQASELSGHVSSAYNNIFLSNAGSDDISAAGTLRIEPGDKLRALALEFVGAQLDQLNPGDDLSWLKALSLTYDVSRKDALLGVNAALQLNGADLAHLNTVVQTEDGRVWLCVPELSDKYMETTLEDLNLDSLPLSGGDLFDAVSPEDAEKFDPIVDALPDDKTVEAVLNRYLNEAIDCVGAVEKDTGTLSAEDVSAEYTVLTTTITPETVVKIVETLGPKLKEDKDIKKIILDVAAASGEEGEPKYQEFLDGIDELLADTSGITENMTDDIVMTVYLDKSGDVHGRVIDSGKTKLELMMPEDGSQFGLTLRYTQNDDELFLLTGSGKRSGDKLTGMLDLTLGGEYYAELALDGFDVEKFKDGYLVGGVEVRPTASLTGMLIETLGGEDALPASVRSLFDSLTLRLDMNTSNDKAEIRLTVTNGSEKLVTISIDGTKAAAKKLAAVTGVEPDEWVSDISLDKLETVVANIEKAGVPVAYTDLLDAALDSAA